MSAATVLLATAVGLGLLACCAAVVVLIVVTGSPAEPEPQPEEFVADVLLHAVERDRTVSSARQEMHNHWDAQLSRWQRGDWSLSETPDDRRDQQ